MAPYKYYRVHDSSSATHSDKENGFVAGDDQLMLKMSPRNRSDRQNLFNALGGHLDWYDTTPSPLISVYADLDTAVKSANARVNGGKRRIFIAHIDVEGIEGLCYRYAPKLARDIGLSIPRRALRNSGREFVFLHHIPRKAVTECKYFK